MFLLRGPVRLILEDVEVVSLVLHEQISGRICEQVEEVPVPDVVEQFCGVPKSHGGRGGSPSNVGDSLRLSRRTHVCSGISQVWCIFFLEEQWLLRQSRFFFFCPRRLSTGWVTDKRPPSPSLSKTKHKHFSHLLGQQDVKVCTGVPGRGDHSLGTKG